jgi:O-antigen ligase
MNKDTLVSIGIVLIGLLLWTLWIVTPPLDARKRAAHNADQIKECHRLGGFTLTTVDGELLSCTFPGVR